MVEPLRLGKVLQPVLAQVAQLPAARQGSGRGGDKHLPAVAGRGDPGRSVHIEADIPLLAQVRRPRVDANPHPDRAGGELFHRLRSGPHCPRSCGERDEERVSLRIDLCSAVSTERLAQDAAMLRERMRVPIRAQLVQQPRRALHVSEEEGDRSRREIARHAHHHAPFISHGYYGFTQGAAAGLSRDRTAGGKSYARLSSERQAMPSTSGNEAEAIPVVQEALNLYEQKGNLVSAGKAQALLGEARTRSES